VREWSELVAGPRWKTFIRRFRRGHHRHGGGAGAGGGRKLNYDALSYALNFDEGHGASPEGPSGEFPGYPDFSTRLSTWPAGATRTPPRCRSLTRRPPRRTAPSSAGSSAAGTTRTTTPGVERAGVEMEAGADIMGGGGFCKKNATSAADRRALPVRYTVNTRLYAI
uniref:Uncharacterized protein n=1 Tax=Aegilops tauschii subsp. strangulata TaxID=200361 RepID=A0A452Z9G6_AEGTS